MEPREYRYSGKERDDATSLYYYGHRYYAPWIGRWLSPDPIGPRDGLNLYQFAHADPVGLVDIDGLQTAAVIYREAPEWEDTSDIPEGLARGKNPTTEEVEYRTIEGKGVREEWPGAIALLSRGA